jgi:DNA-binding NarL/FixJ family response regulator
MKLENVKVTKKSEEKATTIISNESLSKSQKMKDLFDLGFEVKEIAARMNVRYNFVYNVVSNYVIVSDLKVENTKVDSKKDKVVELFNLGKSNKEIAIELKTNYNYIYKITKELKASKKEEEVVAEAK